MKLMFDLDAQPEFIVEEHINEATGTTSKKYKIKGIFSTMGEKNRNGRIYPRDIWESEITKYQDNFNSGSINTLMEWEHPARTNVDPMEAVAKITALNVKDKYVIGEAVLLDNPKANQLKSLIDNGIKISVSSRGVGAVKNGIVENFKLVTYDIVAAPSDYNATMNGLVESYQLNEGVIEELSFSIDSFGNIVTMNECEGACHMFDKKDIDNAIKEKFTNLLKNLNKHDLWHKWSSQSQKYNKYSNNKIWRNLKHLNIGIDYLLKLLNIDCPVEQYKQYIPLTFDLSQINYKQMNHYRLHDQEQLDIKQFTYDDIKHKVIILESCTGTGKTTATAKLLKQYISNYGYMNIISIISRITLGYQIEDSFLKEGITFKNYQNDTFKDYDNYIVCVNSLKKLQDITPEQLKHYIVYIDEINSFTKSLTHNDQLTPILKDICLILFKIIKYAHKIIVSDAVISDSVFKFLRQQINTNPQQVMFIKNDFKKYKGINAYRVKDENKFKELIEEHIKNNDYFLFGCDSCTVIEAYYYDFKNKYDKYNIINFDTKKEFCETSKFRLYTSNVKFNIKNASVEFDKKFNFYSPSIETAIDVTLETPQDVFIYIKGNTIDASSSWQQTTRTRNIKNVYYFCDCDDKFSLYESLDEVDKVYETCLKENQNLNMCSKFIDIDDEVKMIKNTFYELFIYNEYVKDLYRTSRLQHYEEILKTNEFNLQLYNEDDTNLIDVLEKKEMEKNRTIINESIFNKYINDTDFTKQEYSDINDVLSFLNLPINKTLILEYKDIILDQFKLIEHLNIIKFFKDDNYINTKISEIENKSLSIKCFDSPYHKIKILRQLEQLNKLSFQNLNFTNIDLTQTFKCNNWEYVKKLFRTEKKQPQNLEEFKPLYIQFVKNITSSKLIESKQVTINDKRIRMYTINQNLINYHIKLNNYSNPECRHFNPNFSQFININVEDQFDDN